MLQIVSNRVFLIESKERISSNVLHKKMKSLLQLITWFDDVFHQDLDDTSEAPVFEIFISSFLIGAYK